MIAIKQVDAFTEVPFGGNPAGVVTDARGLNERQMQKIAREMNLSETAFVTPCDDGQADFNVRFFTPAAEIDLCGHATIATFVTLAEEGRVELKQGKAVATQKTKAGVLAVEVEQDGDGSIRAMMTQAVPRFQAAAIGLGRLMQVFDLHPHDFETEWPLQLVYTGLWHLIVPIRTPDAIDRVQPQLAALTELNRELGVITTHLVAPSQQAGSLVYTRDFAPVVGIGEDPATGTASGAMGAYLVKNKLLSALDPANIKLTASGGEQTVRFVSLQGYAIDRPSQISVEVRFTGAEPIQVKVGGRALCMLEGSMRVK